MYVIWAFNTTRNTIILAICCYVSLPLKKVHHRGIEFTWLWKFYMHVVILRSSIYHLTM